MLPFLKKQKDVGGMVTQLLDRRNNNRMDIQPDLDKPQSEDHDRPLEDACSDLLAALERKSIPDIREALKSAFECLKGYSEASESEQD